MTRTETDMLGTMEIADSDLQGIASKRATQVFHISNSKVHPALIEAMGAVKLACLRTNRPFASWSAAVFSALEQAAREVAEGLHHDQCQLDALQGGAGTSTNLNVNEVIANRASVLLGTHPGNSEMVHPIEDVNLHQSTNDTFPTAIKVAALRKLNGLEGALVALVDACQKKEAEFADVVKVGRTEMQDAVLTTLGRSFGAFADAFARDRWRVEKCRERLRVVNLGGTAIGTGLGAPRAYIFRVVDELRNVTGLPLARAENLIDATQNCDAFVEVMGIQKALATNLFKISNDLRLISSGPDAGIREINLPPLQTGSSMMPGKINPVIPEAVMQASLAVMGHEQSLAFAAALGNLELNAFLPLIGHALLESLDLLTNATQALAMQCICGIQVERERCARHAENSLAAVNALVPLLGYDTCRELAKIASHRNISIKELATGSFGVSEREYAEAVSPEAVTRLGFSGPTLPRGNVSSKG